MQKRIIFLSLVMVISLASLLFAQELTTQKDLTIKEELAIQTQEQILETLLAEETQYPPQADQPMAETSVETQPLSFPEIPTNYNLLKNSSFESWSEGTAKAPDTWSVTSNKLKINRNNDYPKTGSYSARLIYKKPNGSLSQDIAEVSYYQGKTINLGIWVRPSTPNQVRLFIFDGSSYTYSEPNTGSDSFEPLNLTTTLSDSATSLKIGLTLETSGTVYVDSAFVYELTSEPVFIPSMQDDLKMPSNLIYTDLVNQFVGIATDNPKLRLDINGPLRIQNIWSVSPNLGEGLELLYDTSSSFGLIQGYDRATSSLKDLYLQNKQIQITPDGKLGIGLSSAPTETLEVSGNIKATGSILSGDNELLTQISADSLYLNHTGDETKTGNLTMTGTLDATDFLKSGTPLVFSQWITSGSDIYYNSGKVGIGIPTPNNTLQVANLINFDNATFSTFLGYEAGKINSGLGRNTFIGYRAGNSNTTGYDNTFLGYYAGYSNTTGYDNTFLGSYAGNSNTTGDYNIFLGPKAGYSNTTGNYNTFLGGWAGLGNTTGYSNTFLGDGVGKANTTGYHNTFVGRVAGSDNTTGYSNTFLGTYTGYYNTEGRGNTFLGDSAGNSNTTGNYNTFLGYYAGKSNTTGTYNTFLGYYAGYSNTTGTYNTFLGRAAGYYNTTGNSNTFLGYFAGRSNTEGTGNVFIGDQAGFNETGSNKLYIANSSGTPLIYGDFSAGKVGIGTTSPNYKLDVSGTINATEFFKDGSALGQWGTNGSNIYYTSGNVGIGTTSPNSKLDVVGSLNVTGEVSGAGFSGWDDDALDDITTSTSFSGDVTGTYDALVVGNDSHNHTTSTLPSSVIVEGENISLLNNNAGYITDGNTNWDNTYGYITDGNTGWDNSYGFISSESDPKVGSLSINYIPKWGGSSLSTGSIYDNGKIGIGTTSPELKLHVHENQTWGGAMVFSNNNADARWEVGIPGYANSSEFHIYDRDLSASRLWINDAGSVGIGTTSPTQKLDVAGSVKGTGLCIGSDCRTSWPSGGGGTVTSISAGTGITLSPNPITTTGTVSLNLANGNTWTATQTFSSGAKFPGSGIWDTSGNVGIGTTSPAGLLDVYASSGTPEITLDAAGRWVGFVSDSSSHPAVYWNSSYDLRFAIASAKNGIGWSEKMRITSTGNVGIGTTTPQTTLDVNGTTQTKVLKITGGSDIAEPFEVKGEEIKPGTVLAIDTTQSGKLKITDQAYDQKVAGIVSGAKGINPGLILQQEGTTLEGGILVAMSGRVWCLADTSNGEIKPGDLLTTSSKPGYAMKVTEYQKAQGAIIGKAMTELEEREGLVLVLVTLQ